ncbi:MAG TPA: hypothetical protein VKT82_12660 [Ktedonobacterales bacterium]|nr:hypothetical protein [Ktedonobacterales bacterium]
MYSSWQGLISYSGVGQACGADTHKWLVDWLKHDSGQRDLEEVAEIIRSKGSQWLAQIYRDKGILYRHTFIIGAFVGRKPHVILISNYERVNNTPQLKAADRLFITSTQPREPQIFITGIPEAVSDKDRKTLKILLRAKPEPEVLHRAMAKVNQAAALSTKVHNGISEACLAHSIYPDNKGTSQPYGEVNEALSLQSLMQGQDTGELVRNFLKEYTGGNMANVRIVQTASAFSQPTQEGKGD